MIRVQVSASRFETNCRILTRFQGMQSAVTKTATRRVANGGKFANKKRRLKEKMSCQESSHLTDFHSLASALARFGKSWLRGYEPEGREFESPRAHHFSPAPSIT